MFGVHQLSSLGPEPRALSPSAGMEEETRPMTVSSTRSVSGRWRGWVIGAGGGIMTLRRSPALRLEA